MLKVYSDGGSRGNPGPSAIAFLILSENNEVLRRNHRYLGTRTNNQAEYEALITALECALEFSSGIVNCFLDSEVVVKHLNGEYKVKDSRLKDLWLKVRELRRRFDGATFFHVPRTNKYMQEVDLMVNQELDMAAH